MNEQLKKRLVGASVLVALVVIFVPMLVEEEAGPVAPLDLPTPPPLIEPQTSALRPDRIPAPVVPEPVSPPEPSPAPVLEPSPAPPPRATVDPSPDQPVAAAPPSAPETPSATGEPRGDLESWVIQVGSFREQARATALVERLRKAGIDTLAPERVEIKGTTWYRVRVGPEVNRERADALRTRVKTATGLDGRVIRYP